MSVIRQCYQLGPASPQVNNRAQLSAAGWLQVRIRGARGRVGREHEGAR